MVLASSQTDGDSRLLTSTAQPTWPSGITWPTVLLPTLDGHSGINPKSASIGLESVRVKINLLIDGLQCLADELLAFGDGQAFDSHITQCQRGGVVMDVIMSVLSGSTC